MAAGDKIKNQKPTTHFNWIDSIDFAEDRNVPRTGDTLPKIELTSHSVLTQNDTFRGVNKCHSILNAITQDW